MQKFGYGMNISCNSQKIGVRVITGKIPREWFCTYPTECNLGNIGNVIQKVILFAQEWENTVPFYHKAGKRFVSSMPIAGRFLLSKRRYFGKYSRVCPKLLIFGVFGPVLKFYVWSFDA